MPTENDRQRLVDEEDQPLEELDFREFDDGYEEETKIRYIDRSFWAAAV